MENGNCDAVGVAAKIAIDLAGARTPRRSSYRMMRRRAFASTHSTFSYRNVSVVVDPVEAPARIPDAGAAAGTPRRYR